MEKFFQNTILFYKNKISDFFATWTFSLHSNYPLVLDE